MQDFHAGRNRPEERHSHEPVNVVSLADAATRVIQADRPVARPDPQLQDPTASHPANCLARQRPDSSLIPHLIPALPAGNGKPPFIRTRRNDKLGHGAGSFCVKARVAVTAITVRAASFYDRLYP